VYEEGIQIRPDGYFNTIANNRVEGFYQGQFNGSQVKVYAIGLINQLGKGVNILVLTETGKFNQQHKKEASKLAQSVKFYNAIDSQSTTQWKQKIVGSQLKYMHTSGSSDYDGGYSGVSDKVFIELCSNGSFYYYSNSQANFDNSGGFGSVTGSASNTGIYIISSYANQSYLTLNFHNGEIKEFDLSTNASGNTFLNNTRYFVTDLASCQ
jgi:hypothetical protein